MKSTDVLNFAYTLFGSVALLVIISLGLAVIFGMMGVINLAHGEFIMLGAYLTLTGSRLGLPIVLAMVAAALGVGVFGMVVERLLIQHLYGRLAGTMLATWGLSLIMVQAVQLVFGTSSQGIDTPLGSIRLGDYSISQYQLVMICSAGLLLGIAYFVLNHTRYGTMARAAATKPSMAAAIGIDVRWTNMLTFGFGAALAGAGGALLAPVAGVVPTMGQTYVGQAFMTVVVGGPQVLFGTASAAGLLGGTDAVVSDVGSPVLGTASLLVLAIVLLRFLPTGISGQGRKS